MAIKIEVNGMIYDEKDPNSAFVYYRTQGVEMAFIKVFAGISYKYFWGVFDPDNREESIKEIMRTGAKWDNLAEILYSHVS